MTIAVLDFDKDNVDIISIDDKNVPEGINNEWIESILSHFGYNLDSISWMATDKVLGIRKLTMGPKKDIQKTPKNLN